MTLTKAERLRRLLDDLESEARVVDDMVAFLTPEEWERPTTAEGWTIKDQVTHLAYFDQTAEASARNPEWFRAEMAEVLALRSNLPDEVTETYRGMEPGEARAWFRSARSRLLDTLASADPSARVPWFGPDMSVMSSATARLMETWAHGHDIAESLGVVQPATDRLHHIAHLGVQTFAFSFQSRGRAVPDSRVRVELTAPDGAQWVWGPDGAPHSVTGSALDFCLVVTRRRHVDDTALVVTGEVAAEWMTIAQAFAGGPGAEPRSARTALKAPYGGLSKDLKIENRPSGAHAAWRTTQH
ncbi:TIGR03084 family metal-binding protein [Streptomyces sp. NPDC001833]|uniref:TIGR03084 family metal-binding protein n=1 Tax=Streptomyces sp. NPDC001833 TaxID=3154658 RepID=UPI0033254026